MSTATEYPPVVDIPDRARPARPSRGWASLSVLPTEVPTDLSIVRFATAAQQYSTPAVSGDPAPVGRLGTAPRPADRRRTGTAPVTLTRRGVVALWAGAALVGLLLMAAARLSGPPSVAPTRSVTGVVVVRAGDTLWSLAGRVAPGSDPRAVVARLEALNHLDGVALQPGQVLHIY